MKSEYKIKELNPRKNPYATQAKQQITINLNTSTVTYFKNLSAECGVPYQTLINIYLDQCVKEEKKIIFA